ncbi:GNAT family N-acetyltransferase [Paenibacillus segetis]|uniref:N-acetyltransferase domain-containing protein n=1 Tax=Paenibacillus segetis TaxID=1325360 RepID=A0ABQ1YKU7_9BACL|nr:GNAT family N-acetyltransferase [Paenibacillus segetis]GGH29164.1 hypothetical protein GCM10008013_31600 [Paenibacillus segetis]
MSDHGKIEFVPLQEEDIVLLTTIMTRSFDEDARIHLGEGHRDGPAGYDNGEFLMRYGVLASNDSFTILMHGEAIGVAIVWIQDEGNYYLESLFIDSSIQNMGIGTRIWRMIESKYPDAKMWKTATPGTSKRNHHFYIDKCGFKLINILNPGDIEQETYELEKKMM